MKKPFIVAEISGNHMGDLGRCKDLIAAAKWAGADAAKIQTYDPERMVLDKDYVIRDGGLWDGENLRGLYEKSYTPRNWHQELFDYAREIGIELFSSPFSPADVDFLETLQCPRYKVASLEITDLNLIRHIARTGKPMIISTGGASEKEILEAIVMADSQSDTDRSDITLLKCTAAYPALAEDQNLITILHMSKQYHGIGVGLSDHSIGADSAVIATSLGAVMIEKHLTMDDGDGPDGLFSLTPTEFKLMVAKVGYAHKSLGYVTYGPKDREMIDLRRSVYFTQDLVKGDVVAPHHLTTARPALGIPASRLIELTDGQQVLKVTRNVEKNTPVQKGDIEPLA
jgi:pseudaminic acid synthase